MYHEEYLDMCKKAVDIQKLWEPKKGDYIQFGKNIQIVSYVPIGYPHIVNTVETREALLPAYNLKHQKHHITWLPRQDQLQKMVLDEKWGCDKWEILHDIYHVWWINNSIASWTFEQNWLAYVMLKKYNKIWMYNDWSPIK